MNPPLQVSQSFGKLRAIKDSFKTRTIGFSCRHYSTSSKTINLPATSLPSSNRLNQEQLEVLTEASALTKSLYRICIRSASVIRAGNEKDEKEFAERERKQMEPPDDVLLRDPRLSMLSMLPPVDRVDELRSRYEYYVQYTRENFIQESDCFSLFPWSEKNVIRFLFVLRRGEDHRKWLLSDMDFEDPFHNSFNHSRVDRFEQTALACVRSMLPPPSPFASFSGSENLPYLSESDSDDDTVSDADDDSTSDDDDDDDNG